MQNVARQEAELEETPKKKGMLVPLLLGLFLAGIGGIGGYWTVTSGPLAATSTTDSDHAAAGGGSHGSEDDDEDAPATRPRPELDQVAFVTLDSLVVNIGSDTSQRHLLFEAELEVAPGDADDVSHLVPRVMDVMNSYLRAVEVHDLSEPAALLRIRAQLLRRIQVVTGEGRVRDLLVTSFLIS